MRGLFGFSIVKFIKKRKRARWISLGLEPREIQLNNGTHLHCWVLQSDKPHREKQQRPVLLLIFFGESTTTSSERTEIFQAECLRSMLHCLGVKSVIVVGHSYGGFVAFWMAHKYPNLVQRLIIISSAVCMTPSTYDSLLKEYDSNDIKDFLVPIDAKGLKISLNVDFYKFPWLPAFIYEDLWKVMEKNREQKLQLADAIVIGSSNLEALPAINQEVLIVWGENDRFFRLEEAHALQRHIGEKGKLVVIKECGHVPPLEKPKELNQTILEFLQSDP